MNHDQSRVLGGSFDGFKDRWCMPGQSYPHGSTFQFASVVLPTNQFAPLLTHKQAAESRIAAGLSWPLEAQVHVGQPVRRVPVAYAWRLLIDAADKAIRWAIGGGVSFPLSRILAAHIAGALPDVGDSWEKIIVAIPNDLDEFGQDRLLQALKRQGLHNVQLVWRPIAAALTWLEKTQETLPEKLSSEDFIIVAHFGPDCLEVVPLRLREREFQGRRYVIPLRQPPTTRITLSGCDWAANLIADTVNNSDPAAFWQAFTSFPEIWQALAQQAWYKDELPRVWSLGDTWGLWNPPQDIQKRLWDIPARLSTQCGALTRGSCRVERQHTPSGSWMQLIQTHIRQAAETYKGQLRGMILSGPLGSALPHPWLEGITSHLEAKGLRTLAAPEAASGRIWIPPFEQDAIAEGAAIYGARLLTGAPTYLDTLEPLFSLVQDRGQTKWVALLNDEVAEGGKPFTSRLKSKFFLQNRTKNLQVYLRKGTGPIKKAIFQFPYAPSELTPLDTEIEIWPASGLARVEIIPIPEKRDFLRGQRVFLDYSTMEEVADVNIPQPKLGFPTIARIQVDPEDGKILSESFLQNYRHFMNTSTQDLPQYCQAVQKLRDAINVPITFLSSSQQRIYGRMIDQNGKSGSARGQAIIDRITAKLGSDMQEIQQILKQVRLREQDYGQHLEAIKHIRQTATWFFAGAPPEVVDRLRSELERRWRTPEQAVIEAAGRSFATAEDLRILYTIIAERIHHYHSSSSVLLPHYSARAICRTLEWRELAPDALTRTYTETFIKQALIDMEQCVAQKNLKLKFFQAVKLFLYLLRYREIDQDFLRYENIKDREIFDRIIACLETAKNYFSSRDSSAKNQRISDMIAEIKKYMLFEGGADFDIISLLNEQAGM